MPISRRSRRSSSSSRPSPSLGGQEIEPYANALFRQWKLGQADKNNGVLFLIAPHEHRMRIEVGYGLEGTLTDATSKLIIANAAAPRFKTGDYDGGVTRAVEDIVTALTTDVSDWKPELRQPAKASESDSLAPLLIFLFIVIRHLEPQPARRGAPAAPGSCRSTPAAGPPGRQLRRAARSDSGFSGGGGSSGGGGASGSW